MCAAKAEPSAPPRSWQRGVWGGTGYRGSPRTTSGVSKGVYKAAGQTTEDAHHWGPLCMGGGDTQGPTITWDHTRGWLKAPAPCSPLSQTPPVSPFPEGQGQQARVLTGLRRCGQREGREKRHLVRERQVSTPSPPAPIAPLRHGFTRHGAGGVPPPPASHRPEHNASLPRVTPAVGQRRPERTQTLRKG